MKRYGIRISLPPGDPMRAAHLLGDKWEVIRWFESPSLRDEAFADMNKQLIYYRSGDNPSQILEKVDE